MLNFHSYEENPKVFTKNGVPIVLTELSLEDDPMLAAWLKTQDPEKGWRLLCLLQWRRHTNVWS